MEDEGDESAPAASRPLADKGARTVNTTQAFGDWWVSMEYD
jgi:hypothetical protein